VATLAISSPPCTHPVVAAAMNCMPAAANTIPTARGGPYRLGRARTAPTPAATKIVTSNTPLSAPFLPLGEEEASARPVRHPIASQIPTCWHCGVVGASTTTAEVRSLRASSGDLARIEALYRTAAADVLRWFRSRVPDLDVATDLLSETFAQAVVGIGRCRATTDDELAAWMWGIARNLLRRYYRAQRVERSARDRIGMAAELSTPGPDEHPQADPRIGAVLRAALDDLTAETRTCVQLRLVDELSYEAIARQLECSEAVVRQRVSRGLRRLAVLMEIER